MKPRSRATLTTGLLAVWLGACMPPQQRLARSLAENGLWLELEARLLQELERQPNSPELHNNLGVCYEALGKLSLAMTEYENALKLAPTDESIRTNLELAKKREESAARVAPGEIP